MVLFWAWFWPEREFYYIQNHEFEVADELLVQIKIKNLWVLNYKMDIKIFGIDLQIFLKIYLNF